MFTFAIYCRPSVCRLSCVCLSSVTFVRPTQAVEIFDNISAALGTLGELNTTGVAKYSDFGPIEGYISETVQDGR